MTSSPARARLVTLAATLLVAAETRADTFDLLSYTPPAGWTAQPPAPDARNFIRKDAAGSGIIMVFASRAATGSPESVFAEEWNARVAPSFPGAPPKPLVQPMGDVQVAGAATQGTFQQQPVAITFVTVVGRGRAQSVVTIAAGNEIATQTAGFLGTVQLATTTATTTTPPPPASGGADVELGVTAPPGYTLGRDARGVVLAPNKLDRETPCTYGVTPPRPSSGNLEADAQAAFNDIFAGWQKLRAEEHNHHRRGLSSAGWPYHWYRAELQRTSGAGRDLLIGMVMVLPATNKRVHVLYGAGDLATCRMEDLVFARIFHSLKPRGASSDGDGAKAFARDLPGSWISSQGARGAMVYVFTPDGRYQFGLSATTRQDFSSASTPLVLEKTSNLYHEGRWSLRDGELTLLRDGRSQPSRARVRIADEYEAGTWVRALYFLDGEREVQYLRQNWRPQP